MFHLSHLVNIIPATLTVVLLTTGCRRYQRYTHFRILPEKEILFGEPVPFLPTTAPPKKPKPPKKTPEEKPPKEEVEVEFFKLTLPRKILSRMPYKARYYSLVVPYLDLCLEAEKECDDKFDWESVTPWLFKDSEKH